MLQSFQSSSFEHLLVGFLFLASLIVEYNIFSYPVRVNDIQRDFGFVGLSPAIGQTIVKVQGSLSLKSLTKALSEEKTLFIFFSAMRSRAILAVRVSDPKDMGHSSLAPTTVNVIIQPPILIDYPSNSSVSHFYSSKHDSLSECFDSNRLADPGADMVKDQVEHNVPHAYTLRLEHEVFKLEAPIHMRD